MTQTDWLATLRQHRAIAIIRAPEVATGQAMGQAAVEGGIRLLEVTWNSAQPAQLLQQLRQQWAGQGCQVGVGTILSIPDLEQAIAAGAQFCVTPHTSLPLIQRAQTAGLPIIAGALTPTEIATAWQAGVTSVKVFPIQSVGGVAYLRHLQGPLGQIPLIPTGGVSLEQSADFLEAGAIAIGLAGSLFPAPLVEAQDWPAIRQRSRQLCQTLQRFCQEAGPEPIPAAIPDPHPRRSPQT